MTPAEFKTIREGLGLSAHALGAILNPPVGDRTIRHWESGQAPVPEGAARELADLDSAVEIAAMEAVDFAADAPPGTEAALLRYRSDDDLRAADPITFTRLRSAAVHGALIGRVRLRLITLGLKPVIIYFDPENYRLWRRREKLPDNSASRAAWAAEQEIPVPRRDRRRHDDQS